MKITIESTTKIVKLNEIPTRVWEGETDSGIKVHCFIAAINVSEDEPNIKQFEKELKRQKTPSAEAETIPLRMII